MNLWGAYSSASSRNYGDSPCSTCRHTITFPLIDPLTARRVRPTRAYGVGLARRNGGHQSTNSVIGDFAGAESSHVAGRPSVNRRFGKLSRSASMPTAISVLANTVAMQL